VLSFRSIQNSTWPSKSLIGCDIFDIFSQNYFILSHYVYSCHKCSLCGSEEVSFWSASKSKMATLISVFDFFSRKTACYITRYSRNVPLGDPMSFSNGENLISVVLSHIWYGMKNSTRVWTKEDNSNLRRLEPAKKIISQKRYGCKWTREATPLDN